MLSLGVHLSRQVRGWSAAAHLVLLAVVTVVTGACFLQEPVLGDDLTYWGLALNVHEHGLAALRQASFYDLRWPVWAMCWLLQAIAGRGLVSYWSVPLVYLAAGAVLTFIFGKRLTKSVAAAWAAAIAFVFHPFLDAVFYCPMPDLSEAVWGAAAMLAWWESMHAPRSARACFCAVLTGLCIFILEANRITGLFLVPVLVLCTLLFFRRRFHWLIAAGVIAIALYALECFFYHQHFGNWLHDLAANATNKGAQGTDFPHPWMLPFRFFDAFWHDPLIRFYTLSAAAGIWFSFRHRNVLWRVLVVWSAVLLLEYSCTPQSLSPLRPLVRDGTRFLACLAVPMSLLAVLGFRQFLALAMQSLATRSLVARGSSAPLIPIVAGFFAILLAVATTKRNFFDLGFVPEFRRYLVSVPDGAAVFSHSSMREIVNLIDPRGAQRFHWVTQEDIPRRDPVAVAKAAACDEFWFDRTLAWQTARQDLYRRKSGAQPPLASYFAAPEHDWMLANSIMKSGSPELVFYRKRPPAAAQAQVYKTDAADWGNIVPSLPAVWERGRNPSRSKVVWPIPEQLRGQLVRLEVNAASEESDPCSLRLRFISGTDKQKVPFVFRPHFYPGGGMDFFTLRIPAASTACEIQLRFANEAQRVAFTAARAVVEPAVVP